MFRRTQIHTRLRKQTRIHIYACDSAERALRACNLSVYPYRIVSYASDVDGYERTILH